LVGLLVYGGVYKTRAPRKRPIAPIIGMLAKKAEPAFGVWLADGDPEVWLASDPPVSVGDDPESVPVDAGASSPLEAVVGRAYASVYGLEAV